MALVGYMTYSIHIQYSNFKNQTDNSFLKQDKKWLNMGTVIPIVTTCNKYNLAYHRCYVTLTDQETKNHKDGDTQKSLLGL